VASFLLLVAAIGAVILARRRGGIDDEEVMGGIEAKQLAVPAPPGVGGMREAVGTRHGRGTLG
jgi:hypothetical protein